MKSIVKEIAIIILLCLAIFLVLGLLFYNYIPTNLVVPGNVEAYATSDAIKDEINEEIVEYPKENFVFEITDSDLTLYRKVKSYDAGKANPFASSNETNTVANSENEKNTTSNDTVKTNTNTSKSESTVTNSTETFFQDTKGK